MMHTPITTPSMIVSLLRRELIRDTSLSIPGIESVDEFA
jgi:hypothetical protein